MIFVDTGAFYALIDKNDVNHLRAKKLYKKVAGREVLCTSLPVLTEAWLLIEARLGGYFANRLWQAVCDGAFEVLPLERGDLELALETEKKYSDAGFGFVDATCFALCEKHQLRRVFTFDRKHFTIYRPGFTEALEPVP